MQKIVLIILNLIIKYKIVRKNFYDEINKINKKTTFRFYNEKNVLVSVMKISILFSQRTGIFEYVKFGVAKWEYESNV